MTSLSYDLIRDRIADCVATTISVPAQYWGDYIYITPENDEKRDTDDS